MPNYYEILKVSSSATRTEIEEACESQYNLWRRLVTHHDPSIVNQANQSLQALETIRQTLADPDKRVIYDAAIGVSGQVGALADPDAILHMSMPQMTPPAPHQPPIGTRPAPVAGSSLWTCPQCGTDNPAQTRHCFKCGTELVRVCPECKQMTSLVATGMCGHCGYRYDVAVRHDEIRTTIQNAQHEISLLSNQVALAQTAQNNSRAVWWVAGGLVLCGLSGQNYWILAILGAAIFFFALQSRQAVQAKQASEASRLNDMLAKKSEELRALEQESYRLESSKTRL
jgi:hypothetical protein